MTRMNQMQIRTSISNMGVIIINSRLDCKTVCIFAYSNMREQSDFEKKNYSFAPPHLQSQGKANWGRGCLGTLNDRQLSKSLIQITNKRGLRIFAVAHHIYEW